uniref:Fibrinogen C-terminal domain-containing protein n=1 Tax=Varanus komodoensis TaxID=61221 RepID=A0A8D2KR95_VARKO
MLYRIIRITAFPGDLSRINCVPSTGYVLQGWGLLSLDDPHVLHCQAYCDMVADGGGWTMIQRRQDGTVDFNRTWQEYRQGFGSLQGEHWLGNEYLHLLTRVGQHVLRIELEDWHGVKRHAIYRKFKVASEAHLYRLTAREYQGSAGNALSYSRNYNHDHKCFTTWDSDNDNYPLGNCGAYYGAGWWFDSCLAANLNGKLLLYLLPCITLCSPRQWHHKCSSHALLTLILPNCTFNWNFPPKGYNVEFENDLDIPLLSIHRGTRADLPGSPVLLP